MCVYVHAETCISTTRHHLQALRHFYVLAAERRVLVTVDNASGKTCSVPVCVTTGHGELTAMSPCIVPSWEDIIEVIIIVLMTAINAYLATYVAIYVLRHSFNFNY